MAEGTVRNDGIKFVAKKNATTAVTDKLKKVTTIFYDLDNTLIPTRAGDVKACREIADLLEKQYDFAQEEALSITETFLKNFRQCPDNSKTPLDIWRTHLWREVLPTDYKSLAEQVYPKWLSARYRHLALSKEFEQLLQCFRRAGFLLALITNGPANAQWEKINEINVSQYFDCVLVSADLPWEKPNPNIFYAACDLLGVEPAECAMIGDRLESDIKGGCQANLAATFWLPLQHPNEYDLNDAMHQPDFILQHLLDLYKHFPILSTNITTETIISTTNATKSTSTNAQTVATTTTTTKNLTGSIKLANTATATSPSSKTTKATPDFATTTTIASNNLPDKWRGGYQFNAGSAWITT